MIINNNIPAMNTHRQMGINQQANQNSMEKLSSGLRINRAGDDAAGLAISEKMRAQINGLDQASRNSQDGISMIQTAEGALDESHSILQRMRELATQSANDTNVEVDREELQKEVDQLSQELSRIGDNTEFNTQNLLDGSFEGTFHIGANEGQNLDIAVDDMRGFELGMAGDATVEVASSVTDQNDLVEGEYTVSHVDGDTYELLDQNGDKVAESTDGGTVYTGNDGTEEITFASSKSDTVTSGTIEIDGSGDVTAEGSVDNGGLEAGTYTYDSGDDVLLDRNGETVATATTAGQVFENADGDVVATFTAALDDGDEIEVGGIDISSQASADSAITDINDAIESVSAQRSELGAYQNRLEHTISNLDNASENLSAAESRIRDVDMAAEMMEMTRSNILSQASQSMLAQANQQPQSVLQLLG
ncbi:flagellin [Alteribacillus sp. YIM 98480]|uniref:flagellin N-terminal helical domain-containing protein n=1 Tax=Alteribacillus sp. YIM 98480 TaxID=2606599 RepID=UPI00131CB0DF|nr:flagellin [Alteribacillus sp. YIM 98480]